MCVLQLKSGGLDARKVHEQQCRVSPLGKVEDPRLKDVVAAASWSFIDALVNIHSSQVDEVDDFK